MPASVAGGVDGSSLPAMASTGAEIDGSCSRRSSFAMASQHPAYPSAGVPATISSQYARSPV
jgi:hypothetical protein